MDPERTARAIIGVVGLVFSKVFLRAIFFLILLIFISSFFPWTKALYDGIFQQTELRIKQINHQGVSLADVQLGNEWWYHRAVTVENRGNSPANQVFISAMVPWGEITRYKIYSDYPYQVHDSTNIAEGYLLLALDRLAPGAKITIYIWGTRSIYSNNAEISFAAVYDMGSAPLSTAQSSSDQIQATAEQIRTSFGNAAYFIRQNEKVRELASGIGMQGSKFLLPSIPPYLAVASLTIAFIAWLFLDSIKAALIHGIVASGIYWLRVENFFVPPGFIIASTIPIFIFFVLQEGLVGFLYYRVASLVFKKRVMVGNSPVYVSIDRENWWRFAFSVLVFALGVSLQIGVWPTIHQTASYIMIVYIVSMLSLALL